MRAGMARWSRPARCPTTSVSHARRDGPRATKPPACRRACSPCAQGWTAVENAGDAECFPCAQGWTATADLPVGVSHAQGWTSVAPPVRKQSHARRDGPFGEVRRTRCFPRAGMSRRPSRRTRPACCVSLARRDGPAHAPPAPSAPMCFPCAQGWPGVPAAKRAILTVFPMRAGLDRAFHGVPVFPARRDVPLALRSMDRDRGCFPRRRDGPQWPLP